jgi:hypothetical protein
MFPHVLVPCVGKKGVAFRCAVCQDLHNVCRATGEHGLFFFQRVRADNGADHDS